MEFCQEIGIEFIVFLGSFFGAVTFPINQVFQFASLMSGTQDTLQRVDGSIFQHRRKRVFFNGTRLCGDRRNRCVIGFEQEDMECGVNTVLWRELEFICKRVDLTDDGEGTNESGTQLSAGICRRWYVGVEPSGHLHDVNGVRLHAGYVGELSPRPSHSPGTKT